MAIDPIYALLEESALRSKRCLDLIKNRDMSQLTITKEKVLEAAGKCSQAKATLEVLFPEVFKKEIFTADDIKWGFGFTCPSESNSIKYRCAPPIFDRATLCWVDSNGGLETSNISVEGILRNLNDGSWAMVGK